VEELELIKKTLRSSHAVMFNVRTIDVDLDEDNAPVFRNRYKQKSVEFEKTKENESQPEP
jgi:hypothetical protein